MNINNSILQNLQEPLYLVGWVGQNGMQGNDRKTELTTAYIREKYPNNKRMILNRDGKTKEYSLYLGTGITSRMFSNPVTHLLDDNNGVYQMIVNFDIED